MKRMRKFQSKIKYILFACALISLVLFQLVMATADDSKHINSYIEWLNQDIKSLIEVSIQNKFNVAEMIYNENIDETTANQLAIAIIEGGETKDNVRNDFLNQYSELYENLKPIGLRQFQFHLPNTESFLRLHKPSAYGDILIDMRQTINATIRERVPVKGLEEGRVLNGYRYVFPILKGDQLVGTVEFSYSYHSIVLPVLKTYQLEGLFILDKDEVEHKSFDKISDLYIEDVLFQLGYLDRDFNLDGMTSRLKINEDAFVKLNLLIKDSIVNETFDGEGFQYIIDQEQLIWAMPIAVKDFTGKTIGIMVFYKNDSVLYELFQYQKRQMLYMCITNIILLVLIILSIYFFVKIKIKASSDSLTKLFNRHYYTENIVNKGVSGSILMIDIDDFKLVNDQYGHNTGDLILQSIATILSSHIRDSDVAIRWGGEEFLVILKNVTTSIAAKKGEYLLELIRAESVEDIHVTVSIGVSQLLDDYDKALKEADEALYYVKSNGKNAVHIYEK